MIEQIQDIGYNNNNNEFHKNVCNVHRSLNIIIFRITGFDRFCGLVVRVHGYRPRVPGLIPGATRISDKQRVYNGDYSASLVQIMSYLKEKAAAPV
jgi:hypothetical protein